MKLNRILAAIAEWINAVLWWREGHVQDPPFEEIQRWRVEGRGVFVYCRRNPEKYPRDVGTIMFWPLRSDSLQQPKDIHFCIDHLEGMAKTPQGHTHQVAILAASHFPDEDGNYDYQELFFTTADLQGLQPRRDLHIRCIVYWLADILRHAHPADVRWDIQFDIARKTCMRGEYNGPPSPYPLDSIHPRLID
jgi:hypothetical protein